MTFNEILMIGLSIITSLGGSAVILMAFSSWLGKVWANRILEKDKNKYTLELDAIKNEYNKDLERLKTELKLTEVKQNIIFSKLHTDRADVIAEIYALLKDVHLNMRSFMKPYEISGEESKNTYLQNTYKAWNEFIDYYPKKLIYLPKPTADELENVATELQTLFSTYQIATNSFPTGTDKQQEINKVLKQMPNILVVLENEFRILLGHNQENGDRLN